MPDYTSGGEESGGLLCPYDGGKRKAEMTAEERTQHERERNRVHARNTRARKKQYMEELKERIENIHSQRATAQRQKEVAVKEKETKTKRWENVLTKVLELRCEGVTNEEVWKELLSEKFELTLPLTPYRTYDPADVEEGGGQVLIGVRGMIDDVDSLTEMCVTMAEKCRQLRAEKESEGGVLATGTTTTTNTTTNTTTTTTTTTTTNDKTNDKTNVSGDPIPDGDHHPPRQQTTGGKSSTIHSCSDEERSSRVHLRCITSSGDLLFEATEGIMCMFNMQTLDARDFGSPLEVESSGMLRATFDDDGKLEELDMMFDGVAVYQQLKRAIGCIPNEQQTRTAATKQQRNASAPVVSL